MKRYLAILAVICGLIANHAQAEILTIDVTVKSVDAHERTVTVTKTSQTKSKDLELEVGKKAQISIDGKEASLDAVKAGQAASVSYETSLELITKIAISTAGVPATMREADEASLKTTGCRMIWTIAEDGESTVTVGRPLGTREPVKLKPIRHDDGTIELQYDFKTPESVQKVMTGEAENVRFDKREKTLVLTHPTGQAPGSAKFILSKFAQFPITLEFEFEGIQAGKEFLVGANLRTRENVQFPFLNIQSDNGFESSANVTPSWIESRNSQGTAKLKSLMDTEDVQLEESHIFHFQIPITNQDQKYMLELGVVGENAPVALRYLSVRGKLTPSLGVALDDSNGKVVAKKVLPGGLGDSIGMKSGDIIERINDTRPGTMKKALELLGEIQIGDEAEIMVKRGSRSVKIEFTAE